MYSTSVMWRDTARPVRIGFLDARAAAGTFVWLLHMSWPTFWLSLFLAAGFVALGHFGITPPAFLRSLRFALAGSERPCFSLYQERRRQR